MGRRVIMVLAMAAAVFGARGLYLLSGLGAKVGSTESDSNASATSHVEVERSAEVRTPLASAANVDEPSPFSVSGSTHGGPPDPSWPPKLTADRNARVRQRYAELFREMDLSAHQIEALVPVLIALDQEESQPRHSGEVGAAPDA